MYRKGVCVTVVVLLVVASAGCSSINVGGVGSSNGEDLALAEGLGTGIAGFGGGINQSYRETFRTVAESTDSYRYEGSWSKREPDDEGNKIEVISERKSNGTHYTKNTLAAPWGVVAQQEYRPSPSSEKVYVRNAAYEGDTPAFVQEEYLLGERFQYIDEDYTRRTVGVTDDQTPVMAIFTAGMGSFGYEGTAKYNGVPVHEFSINSVETLDGQYELLKLHDIAPTDKENVGMIEGIEGTVLIDGDGMVRKVNYNLTTTTGTYYANVEAASVGDTPSEQATPEWLGEAKQKALELEEFEITDKYLKLTLTEGSEPIRGGRIQFKVDTSDDGEDFSYSTVHSYFDRTIRGGETVYFTWDQYGEYGPTDGKGLIISDEEPIAGIMAGDDRENRISIEAAENGDILVDALFIHYEPDNNRDGGEG